MAIEIFLAAIGQIASASVTDRLEEVQVTATRRAQSVSEVSASVSVINDAQIEASQPQIITDALKGVPGVFVQQTTAGQGIPIVRGLKGSQVLHLVDGLRLNNAFFRNAPNQYLALVDASDIERVEVVRGPASTLYGSDAMGGVVQLLSKRPAFEQAPDWQAGITLGSAELSTQSFLNYSYGTANQGWRAHLGYQDIGDRRTGSGERIKPSGYRSQSAGLGWRIRTGDTSEWLLDFDYLEQPSTPRVDELVPGFGEDQAASDEFFFEPNRRIAWSARYLTEPAWTWVDELQFNLGGQRIDDDRRTRNAGSTQRRLEQNRSELWSSNLQLSRELDWGAVTWGVDLSYDEVSSARVEQDIVSGALSPTTARFPTGSTIFGSAAFANVDWALSEVLDFNLGARYSRFDIDLAQADRDIGAQLTPDDLTLSAGLQYALTDQTRLIANVGEGFRAPNIFDLGTLGTRPGNRFNIANPALGPENILSGELGVKHQTERYRVEAFGFYSDFTDQITSVETGEVTPEGRVVVQSANTAEATLYGLEVGGRYLLSDTATAFASFNWIRAEERDEAGLSQPGDRIPPANGAVGVEWDYRPTINVEFRSDFAARQDRLSDRDRRDPRINPDGTSGWVSLAAAVTWRPSDRYQWRLAIDNLLDKRYREHGSGLDSPGRNVQLSFRLR